jgi:hypothetical protein
MFGDQRSFQVDMMNKLPVTTMSSLLMNKLSVTTSLQTVSNDTDIDERIQQNMDSCIQNEGIQKISGE